MPVKFKSGIFYLINFLNKKPFYFLFSLIFLILLVFGYSLYRINLIKNSYDLSAQVKTIIGQPDLSLLDSQFSYNGREHAYYLAQSAIKLSGAEFAPSIANSSVTVGGSSKTKPLFSLRLPIKASAGITTYDNRSNLSFTIAPLFPTLPGKQVSGHTVYPIGLEGGKLIYTVKANGAQEDIIYNKAPSDYFKLQYRLMLPSTLQARMMSNGSIGIYSASPALFGRISYASPADQLRVQKARLNSPKDNLVFELPAARIITANKQFSLNSGQKIYYKLSHNVISIIAVGLNQIRGPFSIDPSIVVVSASNWQLGNNESDIIFDTTNNQITEGGLNGGTISTGWTATTSLPATTGIATSVLYNGYIYEIGGYNGSARVSTVEYASISSNGTLGAWTATTSLPVANYYATSVVYNGYVYEIGGNVGSGSSTIVDYAPINTNGTLGAWTATTSLPVGDSAASSVAYNGYVYEIGGNTTAAVATVDYAPINADGTLGAWTATTSLPVATKASTSVAYNGYIYEIGGYTSANTAAVYYAQINANGTIGSWTATTSLPVATDYTSSVIYNGNLYDISLSQATYYAPVNSDGTLGTWNPTTGLATNTFKETAAVYNGYLYEIGGLQGSTYLSSVYSAPIDPAGVIGSWAATTSLPTATAYATSAVYNGYVYEIGGQTTAAVATVEYAAISTNGTLGSWTATTSLPAATDYSASVVYDGYLYEVGGYTTAASAVVDYAPINTNGTLGAWTATTSLPTATYGLTAEAYDGYLYEIGGSTKPHATVIDVTTVEYAPISSNGTLGAWTATTSLPTTTTIATSAVYNGYIYEIGGYNGSSRVTTVEYAAISTNGTLGSWTATTSLPAATDYSTSEIFNGYLYEIGGYTTADTNTVDYALLNLNGALGSWNTTTVLPTATSVLTSVIYDGFLYEIGGYTSANVVTVEYSYIDNGGSGAFGTLSTTTALPTATEYATSIAYNGYIYEIGGETSSGAVTTVNFAPISSNGTVGAWSTTTALPTATYGATSVAYNGYVYEIGGYTTADTATIEVAGLQSIPRVGIYSTLIDFTGLANDDPTPTKIIINGGDCSSGLCTTNSTNPGLGGISGPGGIIVEYSFASNACTTFNNPTTLPTGLSFLGLPERLIYTTNGCSVTANEGRYISVTYILDDSQTATFPDVLSNHTSISSFTVYYHPATSFRLRGGATFSNYSLQSLDAQP